MTLLTLELEDPHDPRLAAGAEGRLRSFNEAGVLDAADVHVAQRLCALADEEDELVALAVAFVVRAVRGGSVCVDLATVADDELDADWPEPDSWLAAVRVSPRPKLRTLATNYANSIQPSLRAYRFVDSCTAPFVSVTWSGGAATPVLRLLEQDGPRLLYLDRYWREEEQVHADLVGRPAGTAQPDDAWLTAALDRVFPVEGYDEQRAAARVALTHATTVLTGGPGTGKTTTVAALLALCAEQAELAGEPAVRIALAAPTGKAAARLQQAVEDEVARLPDTDRERLAGVRAVTLHRLPKALL